MKSKKIKTKEIKFRIVLKTKAKNQSQPKLHVFIKVGPTKPIIVGQENLT
jgi:hypothetical protein